MANDKPVYSLEQIIGQLKGSWVDKNDIPDPHLSKWGGGAVSYGLLQPMDWDQQVAARQAFELWDDLIAIDLNQQLADPQNAQITFAYGGTDFAGVAQMTLVPLPRGGSEFERWIADVDIKINQGRTNVEYGESGFGTYLHEIGHALGLSHPGQYNADLDMERQKYEADAEYAQDTQQYTVMSYFKSGADGGPSRHIAPSKKTGAAGLTGRARPRC